MQKLNRDEILNLPEGHQIGPYRVKLSRLVMPEPVVIFEGEKYLHIQKITSRPKKPRRLVCITTAMSSWAEYDENDIEEDGSLVSEDYLMEIFRGEEP